MPVVPIYQGGVPQIGARPTPTTSVQLPQPAVDYERVMQAALEPLKLGVASVQKMQEQEQARQIKSLSDEAETAYMRAVQERMYNPETGYMTKQGKTAHDDYQGTVNGLRQDADKILGSLAPFVRDAVSSRISDRLNTAQSQALRWNAQQTQRWHIDSSRSRVTTLTEDSGEHYADTNYLAKSWLSIAQEVNYQARLMGWDEDTRKQQMAAHYDAFQANRLSTWAQDDPIGAYEASQDEKDHMSASVWQKLDAGLWNASKQEIALRLSQMVPPLRSRKDIASVALDRNKRSGWSVVDNLTPARKAEVYSTAWGYMERVKAEGRASLKRAVENSLAISGDEGADPNPLSEDAFVAAYGEEDGKIAYQDYESNLSLREKVFHFNGLTNDDLAQTLEGMKPQRGSENYAVQSENYRRAQKAAQVVIEARQKDPMGAAIQDAKYGLAPIVNWGNQEIATQLAARKDEADQIATDYGTQPVLLTDSEADSLASYIDKLPPVEQGVTLERIADAIGDDGMISVLGAQLGTKNSRLGTAFYLSSAR